MMSKAAIPTGAGTDGFVGAAGLSGVGALARAISYTRAGKAGDANRKRVSREGEPAICRHISNLR